MINKIIECVPNFSEGRDTEVISKITSEIKAVDGVRLLSVEPGKDTNRTVVTFVGEPESVIEAAEYNQQYTILQYSSIIFNSSIINPQSSILNLQTHTFQNLKSLQNSEHVFNILKYF